MMKSIFRTIKNHWPEYFLEILVITLGILGAFLLNSWKENSDRKKELSQALSNLAGELKDDSIQFHYHKLSSTNTLKNVRKVLELVKEKDSNEIDSLEYYYFKARSFILYVPQKSSFESINQLGLLSEIEDSQLLYRIQNYYTFTQPNIKILRDLEQERFESKMNTIDTNPAIIMDEASWDDLPLDYRKVKQILSQPENFRKVYDYGKTEEFLISRAEGYIQVNTELIRLVEQYLANH